MGCICVVWCLGVWKDLGIGIGIGMGVGVLLLLLRTRQDSLYEYKYG